MLACLPAASSGVGANVRRAVQPCRSIDGRRKLVTQRPAKDAEIDRGLKLIDDLMKQEKASPQTAMKYFCLVAMNLNEFMYLD